MVRPRTERLIRLTLSGDELRGLERGLPASSVRLLLPELGQLEPPAIEWNGNEFLLPGGSRPTIRTLTPLRVDPVAGELDIEVVLHGDAPLSRWAETAEKGAQVAVSGTGRGYEVDHAAPAFLLAGDESAIPAISVLLEELPPAAQVEVFIELRPGSTGPPLPSTDASVTWLDAIEGSQPGTALLDAIIASAPGTATRVWAAGEAAAMQRIRRHLFEHLGIPRAQAVVRGYWKRDRHGA
jgi:NADPH-dependent ferric siderophore reductase